MWTAANQRSLPLDILSWYTSQNKTTMHFHSCYTVIAPPKLNIIESGHVHKFVKNLKSNVQPFPLYATTFHAAAKHRFASDRVSKAVQVHF